MASKDQNTKRDREDSTAQELVSSLHYIISFRSYEIVDAQRTNSLLIGSEGRPTGQRWAVVIGEGQKVLVLIHSAETPADLVSGVIIQPSQSPSTRDLDFMNVFVRVFNEDIRTAPHLLRHGDLWQTLRQTQFRRAIAKYSAFSTSNFTRLLQLVENSTSLRYEGRPFNYRLFITKQEQWLKGPLGENYMPFKNRMPYEQALVSEKWIMAAVDGGEVGLVALGHGHGFVAMFSVPESVESKAQSLGPHSSLEPLLSLVVPGTALFVVSEYGDIYCTLPDGATFLRSQGRWRYLNYAQLLAAVEMYITEDLAASVVGAALNLSYERTGALIVVLDDANEINSVVADHSQSNRPNRPLRETLRGKNISSASHLKVILSGAKTDGALVLAPNGEVVDVACMIGDPTSERLQALSIASIQKFSGARSTAAWNASIHGLAIKVSDDGPVTIFHHGQLISAIG